MLLALFIDENDADLVRGDAVADCRPLDDRREDAVALDDDRSHMIEVMSNDYFDRGRHQFADIDQAVPQALRRQ